MSVRAKANRGPSAGPENRLALIAAAREVFEESGLSAPLNSVARRAGVGQGSLYRHFPDRISLAVAVFDDNITDLENLAARPGSTINDFFERVAAQSVGSTAFIDLLNSHRHDPRTEQLTARVLAAADSLLARERTAGEIGPQVETSDLMLAVSMLAFVISRSEPGERADIQARALTMFRTAFGTRR